MLLLVKDFISIRICAMVISARLSKMVILDGIVMICIVGMVSDMGVEERIMVMINTSSGSVPFQAVAVLARAALQPAVVLAAVEVAIAI